VNQRQITIDLKSIKKGIVPKFYPYIFDKTPKKNYIVYGGAGAGKSVAMVGHKSVFNCLEGRNILVIRKVYRTHT
jgi:phage terminase large subunit